MQSLLWLALLFLLGLAAWPLLEYTIHGVLAHGLRTPVSPLHWVHHVHPGRVFTSPLAWVPLVALLYALAGSQLGRAPGPALVSGLLAGFLHYEYVHWRIHFRQPRSERERRLREHHLAHHYRNPKAYLGVTTRFWDRVFGTLPAAHRADYAAVAQRLPLSSRVGDA